LDVSELFDDCLALSSQGICFCVLGQIPRWRRASRYRDKVISIFRGQAILRTIMRKSFALRRCSPLLLFRVLAFGLLVGPTHLFAQRATDPANPQGKWEVLHRCRLVTNSVVDGDSFRVICKDREYGVRLYFVDAPETDPTLKERIEDQAAYFGIAATNIPRAGEQAARFTREKLAGRDFTLQTRWQNALGRGSIARFYCEVLVDGKNLGEELVTHGWARITGLKAVRPDGTRAATVINHLKNLELAAREQRRGVWNPTLFPRDTNAPSASQAKPVLTPITPGNPLDLNTATYEDLQRLPGIGPVMAQRIIAHRPYKQVGDLDKVPGIGEKTLAALRPLVRVKTVE
jgi:competence protein ComEA